MSANHPTVSEAIDEVTSYEMLLPPGSVVLAGLIAALVGENILAHMGNTALVFVGFWCAAAINSVVQAHIIHNVNEDDPAWSETLLALGSLGLHWGGMAVIPLFASWPLLARML